MEIPLSGRSTLSHVIPCVFVMVPLVLALLCSTPTAMAQMPTPEMLEAHVKAYYAAWASLDSEEIAKFESGHGFGFRTLIFRSREISPSERLERNKAFFARMDYFRIELNELHTAVDGDVGLVWGFHTEDYKRKGQNPVKVRVRFTWTLKYDGNRWRKLLYHRDIQKFDESGRAVFPQ